MCKIGETFCKTNVNSGNANNLVSQDMLENHKLKRTKHPNPYKVFWLQRGHQLLVSEYCLVSFHIENYKGEVMCDIIPWMNMIEKLYMMVGEILKQT